MAFKKPFGTEKRWTPYTANAPEVTEVTAKTMICEKQTQRMEARKKKKNRHFTSDLLKPNCQRAREKKKVREKEKEREMERERKESKRRRRVSFV